MNKLIQLKKLISNFNYILKNNQSFYFFRINWLQILRYHPQIFKRYNIIYTSSLGFYFEFFKKLVKYILIIKKQIFRSIFIADNNIYKNLLSVDCILVSHISSKKHLGLLEDFHFRHIHNVMLKNNCSVNFFLQNHINISSQVIEKSWCGSNVPRYVARKYTSLKNEISILIKGIKVFLYFLFLKHKKQNILNRIEIIAGLEAISHSSLNAERFSGELEKFVISVNPKYIIFTFEGHSWERLLINKIKKYNKKIICIGFVHTAIFPYQHANLVNYDKEFMPDYIFVPGEEIAKLFRRKISKSIPIIVTGSPKKKHKNLRLQTRHTLRILILPEGFESESIILINFGINLAKKCPNIEFRVRLHPELYRKEKKYNDVITKEKLSNIMLSNDTFSNDINWSSHAIYRGSTSILEAVGSGVFPLYYGKESELSIDPLFLIKNKKHWVKDIDDTIKKFNIWYDKTPMQKLKQINPYVKFCNNLIKPLDTKVLNKFLKKSNFID